MRSIFQIFQRLTSDGVRVWLDIEQMEGSTLEAMAGAIENSKIIAICMFIEVGREKEEGKKEGG
jgi:hypothetical protein